VKLIFMGTPEFAVPPLQRLIAGHQVASVFTQPDKPAGRGDRMQSPPVKRLALEHKIAVYQPARIKSSEEVRAVFEEVRPDACVVAAYGKILPAWLLDLPRLGCINVHASLLPKYRGAAPINWAIANGETRTGITIMQMDPGMDTGPILSSVATRIGDQETAPELSARLSLLGAELLSETLARLERGEVGPTPQDNALATYAPMLKREHGAIDWNLPAASIANRVRGFQPWPGSYTTFRGRRLIIWRALPGDAGPASHPVSTITRIDSHLEVACGESTLLRVIEVQIEGKNRILARDFANGMRLTPGDRLSDGSPGLP
jgi:methionyl-tRNA formyltransferase